MKFFEEIIMITRKKILIGLFIAIFILIIGYLWKGIPMLFSLFLGYYLIWKAFKRSLERKYEEEYGYEYEEYHEDSNELNQI